MGFPKQEYWSGLQFPSPGDLPTQSLSPGLLHYRQTLYHLSHREPLIVCMGLTENIAILNDYRPCLEFLFSLSLLVCPPLARWLAFGECKHILMLAQASPVCC